MWVRALLASAYTKAKESNARAPPPDIRDITHLGQTPFNYSIIVSYGFNTR